MTTTRNILLGFFLLCVAVALVGGLLWANFLFTQRNPGGIEFMIAWTGARSYAINALNPYSELVAEQVQRQAYGRLAREGEPVYRVDVPFHYILFLTPLGSLDDYDLARAWWMVILELALITLTFLGFSLTQWRTSPIMRGAMVLFGVFWVHAVLPLSDGNLAILVALLFGGALLALRAEADELAGGLLALATVKAEAGILFLVFLLLWSISQQRWGVPSGFFMVSIILFGIGWLFQPDWLWEFLGATVTNLRAGPLVGSGVLLEQALPGAGTRISQVLTGIVATILLFEWYATRTGGFRHVLWAAMLTLSLTPLSGLPAEPSNYVLLYLPLLLVLATMDERWGRVGRWLVIIIMLALFIGLWLAALTSAGQVRALFVPLPLFVTVLLYWVRWWAIRPPRTWLDQVSVVSGRR